MFHSRRPATGISKKPAPAGADRRAANRHVTVLKTARLEVEGRDDLCLIRNISNTGLMIQTSFPLRKDQHVVIEIRSDSRIGGTVRWTHDHTVGIQLDEPTDLSAMLTVKVTDKAKRTQSRAPRFQRRGTARIKSREDAKVAPIDNISLSGVRVATTGRFHVHDTVTVVIDGLTETPGEVSWTSGDAVGVHFFQPLKFRELEAWLLKPEHQPEKP